MDSMTIIAVASIVIAGITTGFGCMGPALAEGKAVAIEATAMRVMLSMVCPLVSALSFQVLGAAAGSGLDLGLRVRAAAAM